MSRHVAGVFLGVVYGENLGEMKMSDLVKKSLSRGFLLLTVQKSGDHHLGWC